VVGFERRPVARLHLLVARDAGLISWVASSGSFLGLEHDERQMLGLKSQRLLSPKHGGGGE
jgi:hypothetical protein